jgi:hypothetical protein
LSAKRFLATASEENGQRGLGVALVKLHLQPDFLVVFVN